MMTIRQLPPYLQLVVTLMENMVPLYEEDRLKDKKGKEALTQSTSMIIVVSFKLFLEFFLSVMCFFPYQFSFLL